jgi:hypothetical protein
LVIQATQFQVRGSCHHGSNTENAPKKEKEIDRSPSFISYI